MTSLVTSMIVFGVVFGGAIVGMVLRKMLPERHLDSQTENVVKLGMGLVGTMAALVLGLLTASAKSSYDAQRAVLSQIATNVTLLDRALAHYGPEASSIRSDLRSAIGEMIEQLWPRQENMTTKVDPTFSAESIFERIQALSPKTEAQRGIHSTAIKTVVEIGQARWQLSAQKYSSIQLPLLVVMMFWFSTLFASFSLFGRTNPTVFFALMISAASIAGAVFLILEMDHPFEGLMQIPSDPLRRVMENLGR